MDAVLQRHDQEVLHAGRGSILFYSSNHPPITSHTFSGRTDRPGSLGATDVVRAIVGEEAALRLRTVYDRISCRSERSEQTGMHG